MSGRLTIVGTGITAVAHMSCETVSYVAEADVVFYHATNGITAAQIRRLNANAIDLYEYYGEGKNRKVTYVQMAELMLNEVRRGLSVVGVFHGHPGVFVRPARRALALASAEGFDTTLVPAISAVDCLFADLRVDPGVFGCQILMASRVMAEDLILATTGHVVFLQVTAVGDPKFSFSGYKEAKLAAFFERLIEIYGEEQETVYYVAALFPGWTPEVDVRPLADYRYISLLASVHAGMLYVPPEGMSLAQVQARQTFRKDRAYGPAELEAVAALEHHVASPEFISRGASEALFETMLELGTSATAMAQYRQDPDAFLERFPDLSEDERAALRTRTARALRRVTSV